MNNGNVDVARDCAGTGQGQGQDEQGYIAHKSMEHVAAKTGQEGYSSDPTDASMWVELKMSVPRVEENQDTRWRCSDALLSSEEVFSGA